MQLSCSPEAKKNILLNAGGGRSVQIVSGRFVSADNFDLIRRCVSKMMRHCRTRSKWRRCGLNIQTISVDVCAIHQVDPRSMEGEDQNLKI